MAQGRNKKKHRELRENRGMMERAYLAAGDNYSPLKKHPIRIIMDSRLYKRDNLALSKKIVHMHSALAPTFLYTYLLYTLPFVN